MPRAKRAPFRTPGRYRIWFREFEGEVGADLEDEVADALAASETKNALLTREFGFGHEERWDIAQDSGVLKLGFADGASVRAHANIVGTFDGKTWLWAWANPSIEKARRLPAEKLRTLGIRRTWTVLTKPTWTADPADGLALAALAGQSTRSAGTFVADSNGTLVFFTVDDPVREGSPKKRRSAKRPAARAASVFEALHEQLGEQMAELALTLRVHREIQELCNRGDAAVASGKFDKGLVAFERAWAKLPECRTDYQPAGWILLSWGNALYQAGRLVEARAKLDEALEVCSSPLLLLRLGQVAALVGEESASAREFLRCFVAGGREAFDGDRNALATLDRALGALRAKLDARVAAAMGKDKVGFEDERRARAIVACLVADLCAFEREANKKSKAASRTRKERHVLSDEDMVASREIDEAWCGILATYCTTGKSPKCPGYGSPPSHDPKKERVLTTTAADDRIEVRTKNGEGAMSTDWLYVLTRQDGRWLVEEAFSCWDDERIPSLA